MRLFSLRGLLGVGLLPLLSLSCSSPDEAPMTRSTQSPVGTSSPSPGNTTGSNPSGGNTGGGMTKPVPVGTAEDGTPIFIDVPDPIVTGGGATGSSPNCGDGVLTDDEACDDNNKESGDGCTGGCLQVEPGFSCAAPGKPCQAIAVCGDGIVAASEQCDDKNMADQDGCSSRCRVEFGKKCEGAPSVCTDTTCGDGNIEGAESCDDGNSDPFDGCSSLCLREPDCSGDSCVSDCGDGLVINEDCDDGNTTDGDGCSAECKKESGFTCTQESTCERVNGECVLRVPAIFRDFSDAHPDFYQSNCDELALGVVQNDLNADGRPVLKNGAQACIDSAESFAQWFTDGNWNKRLNSSLVLFDNQAGGYVNRYGANGEPFVATVAEDEKRINGTCEAGCTELTRNSLQCDNVCRPDNDAVMQTTNQLEQAEAELTRAEGELEVAEAALLEEQDAATPNEATLTQLEATVEARLAAVETRTATVTEITEEIADLQAVADACNLECDTTFDTRTNACIDDCGPCAYPNDDANCTGTTTIEFDGSPLFFPVDSITGPTASLGRAKVPEEYGYNGWPWEDVVFPGAPKHNFYFTSEVQYWFRYEEDTNATLDFTGDDDVWVFVNGKLAVDLGGVHVPEDGTITISARNAANFGLTAGNVYKITVFQVERKMEGSSFKLTLSGFEATPSDCKAICGDGVLSFGEECDDGTNDGGYGECDEGCKLGPYCGDGVVQGDEDCDNGPGGGSGCPACRILRVL